MKIILLLMLKKSCYKTDRRKEVNWRFIACCNIPALPKVTELLQKIHVREDCRKLSFPTCCLDPM